MADETSLPAGDQRPAGLIHREIILLAFLIGIAVVGFFATRAIAAGNQRMRLRDAQAWYDLGRRDLGAGHTGDGVAKLRRAVSKSPQDRRYLLTLAAALTADRQDEAARQVLVELRDASPEDVDVNVELARLEARQGHIPEAVRYYQNALNALWTGDRPEPRRRLRIELVHLLLAHGQRSRALSELLTMTANLDNAPSQVEAGRLFLAAGDPRRALDRFTDALGLDPGDPEALAGAGEATFAMADYARAQQFLAAAPAGMDTVAELRQLTDLVLSKDPMAPRLPTSERIRRLVEDVKHVQARLDACLPGSPLDEKQSDDLDGLRHQLSEFLSRFRGRPVRASSDLIESGVDMLGRVEKQIGRRCGPVEAIDQSLVLIARRHGLEDQ
jgi:tetratricopeptide (TPR) repeat protein